MKLHIGCGQKFLPGYKHVDVLESEHIDFVCDASNLNMIENESVSEIYACHVLEHVKRDDALAVLQECSCFRYYDPESGVFISPDALGILAGLNQYSYAPNPVNWIDPLGLSSIFRGDDFYSGGPMGLPLGSDADITTPWDHVGKKESGQTSIFTSFAETKSNAAKFTKGNNVYKVSVDDLETLKAEGKIRVYTPDDVAEMMRNHPQKKIRKQANNVRENMMRNKEILVEGEIPEHMIKKCT